MRQVTEQPLTPTDYTATTGTVTFTPGQTSAVIPIIIQGDSANNPPETMQVTLSSPSNATIATPTGIGTIDDIAPTISINSPTFVAPLTGTTTGDFTATLSAVSNQTITVSYATADGTATSPTELYLYKRNSHLHSGTIDCQYSYYHRTKQ